MSSSSATKHANFKVGANDWNKTSANYAANTSRSPMSIPITRLIELLDSHSSLSSATSILDIGCGPGSVTSQLISSHHADLPTTAQLLATDFSIGMVGVVSQARASKLKELSPGTEKDTWARVTPLVMDAMTLAPLLDNSISHIVANFVFFMVQDPAKALKESYRVLQPNGVAAISSWSRMQWMESLAIAASRTFPSLGKPTPEMPTVSASWTTCEGVGEQLKTAGFRDVYTEFVSAPIVMPDVEQFAHFFLTSGNPAVTWITDISDEQEVKEVERQFVQVVKENCEKNGEGAYVLAGTAVVAIGRK
ncbi:S-adenosyl-L-methionine-dependent methyltransferase [Aureobasidium sp. EXF-10728]|nr:S-adenosyl-L-methionine-dependent methyltransferase [Aureobasidium sp. EXF-10728]